MAPSAAATVAAGGEDSGALPASKSNPQDSQKRPELAVPQRGQGAADSLADGADGVPRLAVSGAVAGELVDWPIRIPQTSQKSLLAES
jgi:hypothetical protein